MPRIARITALAFGLAGGLAASQGPEFAQQYRQRLGGAVDELRRVVQRFDQDAQNQGETREGAIARLERNGDGIAASQGTAMRANAGRLGRLEEQQRSIAEASDFGRIGIVLSQADPGIARAAWHDFEPALPITREGLISAAAGYLVVWGGILFDWGLFRRLFVRRPREVAAARR